MITNIDKSPFLFFCIFAPSNLNGGFRLMMKRTVLLTWGLSLIVALLFSGCARKSAPVGAGEEKAQVAVPGPPCIVYRTRADFSRLVPVEMTADKSAISSFPGVTDIYRDGELSYPTALNDGYLLDNRGIGPNVAFLRITYEEYRALDGTPPVSELMANILEKDPLVEMYQCGNRSQYKDPVYELNQLIGSGKLSECKRLK